MTKDSDMKPVVISWTFSKQSVTDGAFILAQPKCNIDVLLFLNLILDWTSALWSESNEILQQKAGAALPELVAVVVATVINSSQTFCWSLMSFLSFSIFLQCGTGP